MSTSLFYHYTDDDGAKSIVRSGKILTSLEFMASGDAGFGNGVYLTKLSPETSTKTDIAMNNWVKSSPLFIKKTQNYFVIKIPDCDVKDCTSTGRDIFLLGGRNDLRLHKYSWWLKDFDTKQIIASYKYRIASLGPASLKWESKMGDYSITEDTANGRPVYKHEETSATFLFMSSFGNWVVGEDAGKDSGCLRETSNYSLGPSSNLPWEYSNNPWKNDDTTLRGFAWQK